MILKKLIAAGISHCKNTNELRLLKTINIFALVTLLGLSIGFINLFVKKFDYPLYAELIFFVVSVAIIFLNGFGYFRSAIWLFILNINAALFYVCEFYAVSSGSYLYYFPLVLTVALLHIPGDSVLRTMNYYIITVFLFISSLFMDFDFIPVAKNNDAANAFLLTTNIGISVAVSAMEIIMMLNLINGQNRELLKHLEVEKNLHASATKNLREKEVLLSEVHHRVKNNLAIINGLLNLQKNKTTNTEAATILEDSRNRIISMSLVHEKLYKSNDFSGIELGSYLTELAEGIIRGTGNKFLKFERNIENIKIPVAIAIPVGLMINEAIMNSIKHAFVGSNILNSTISLSIKKQHDELFIQCKDNGKGFNSGFDAAKEDTLGILIIQSLAEQLEGSIHFYNEKGACVDLKIPLATSGL
ncbi:MAG: sensor histidine kinase [Flavobacteriales bacterium]